MFDCIHFAIPFHFFFNLWGCFGFLLLILSSAFFSFLFSYGRLYAADPYHHTLAPATTYGVGAVVSADLSTPLPLPCLPVCPEPPLLLSSPQFLAWLTSSHFSLIEFVSSANGS